jgi:hypothetical protein
VLPRVLRRPLSADGHGTAGGHEMAGGQDGPAVTELDAEEEEAVAEMELESVADALPYEEAGAGDSPVASPRGSRVSRPGHGPGQAC